MAMEFARGSIGVASGVMLVLGLLRPAEAHAQDATKIAGPDACVECHEAAHGALEASTHQSTYRTFHTLDETQAVLEGVGERSAKRAFCVDCHYTQQQAEGRRTARVIAGVTCESCHGAAVDWLDLHNDYGRNGGEVATAETEAPDHRAQRLVETARLGMIRPDQPYELAANCFQCHTVPNETLVNAGDHTAGSEFELVAWAQGEVRHNFQRSNDAENREAARDFDPAARKRLLYVVGAMVDLEYAVRGMAEATAPGRFAEAMTGRIDGAVQRLSALRDAAPGLASAVEPLLAAVAAAPRAPANRDALIAVAEQVAAGARAFAAAQDGTGLTAVDPLLPAAGAYKGSAYRP